MMNINEISKILPQKFPFLMVDKVLSLEIGKRLIAIKNITINENYFQGHFLNKSIFPGVLIIEAMAQTAIILYSTNYESETKNNFYLGSVKVQFFKPVIPGDQLKLDATIIKLMQKAVVVEVKAFINEEIVAKSELICVLGE